MKLFSRQLGQGSDLISLHGLFGSLENLGMINRGLSKSFCVHGLDIRNHGKSPHDEAMNYDVMADDVLEYLDNRNLEKVHLVGHSMGGKIAMAVALKAPKRVSKLAVLDIAPVTYKKRRHDEILQALSEISSNIIKKRADADQLLQTYKIEKEIRQFLLKNLYFDKAGNYKLKINLAVITKHYEKILEGQHSDTSFTNETLFIKGENSDYILPEHREETLKLFPLANLQIISGTGHWLHAQKPDLVTRTLLRFFG